jgi:acetoin utilization deacetylase AcuC-like enzyme
VHNDRYIKHIQDPNYVSRVLKIDIVGHWDNFILEYYRAVTGGTLMATAFALRCNIPAFNLGGGFHHAHPDRAEGFCLINDVAIAIEKFRKLGRAERFMVIDLDYHQGNGNLLYFQNDTGVYTFSMHADTWIDIDADFNKDILVSTECDDVTYLSILVDELENTFTEFEPDAVFYIAGSDPYRNDTLAGMKLTREGMLKRNMYVYQLVRQKNIPLVILAGGGYGPESWEVYYDFINYCLTKKAGNDAVS